MRVDVLDVAEEKGTARKFWSQPIALYYKSKRIPCEDMMFLNGPAEQLPVGSYTLDVEAALEPDSNNRNKPMLWVRPKNLVAAKPAAVGPGAAASSGVRAAS